MKWFLNQADYNELLHMQQAFEHEGRTLNLDDTKISDDTIDYAELQADFAARGKRDCENCERLPYNFDRFDRALSPAKNLALHNTRVEALLADGWEQQGCFAGYLRRCEPCRLAPPRFAWIADIDPLEFVMFVQERDEQDSGAWPLEDLKVLLKPTILKTATRLMPRLTGTLTPPCEADLLPFRNFVPERKGFEFL